MIFIACHYQKIISIKIIAKIKCELIKTKKDYFLLTSDKIRLNFNIMLKNNLKLREEKLIMLLMMNFNFKFL